MAIAGFTTAFFCGMVGLFLSIIAFHRINTSGGTRTARGFAVAGIVNSIPRLIIELLLRE